MNAKFNVLNKKETSGRRGLRYVSQSSISAEVHGCIQEMQAKYRESKAELDELVANMEGL